MRTSDSEQDERALRGLSRTSLDDPSQCDTFRPRRKKKNRWLAVVLVLASTGPAGVHAPEPAWPPFLGPRDTFGADVVAAVDRIWLDPTLSRTVRGRPARVPFDLYVALVDLPEVTAAAGRVLGLVRYEVEPLDDDWYRATDNDGSRGVYRVLVREPKRRVMLSWGEHSGSILGTIHGSALTVLDFVPTPEGVEPSLTAHVRIDNSFAAGLARVLVAVFGYVADRKLSEGFTVTARVAEWAMERPAEFCRWLDRQPVAPARRERLLAILSTCTAQRSQAARS